MGQRVGIDRYRRGITRGDAFATCRGAVKQPTIPPPLGLE